jgi:Rod binding domain-containing protein
MASGLVSGSLVTQAQTSLLQAQENRTLRQLQAQQAANNDGKIEKSATEFESMLLSNWLQQAEQSMATVPGADDDEDAAGRDQMMSLGVQSLARSLAATGGIGIGKMIAQALHRAEDKGQAVGPPGHSAESGQTTK